MDTSEWKIGACKMHAENPEGSITGAAQMLLNFMETFTEMTRDYYIPIEFTCKIKFREADKTEVKIVDPITGDSYTEVQCEPCDPDDRIDDILDEDDEDDSE